VGIRKKIKQITGAVITLVVVVFSLYGYAKAAHAEDNDSDRFNYGFLEQYKDGFYIGTNENANIYQLPLSFTVGGAKDLSGGPTKFIYSSGIKSHLLFDLDPFDLTLGNALRNSGYTTFSGGPRDNFWSIETGLDVRFPLGFTIRRKEMLLSIYGVNYFFPGDVVVVESKPEPIEVRLQWEAGLTLSSKEGWRILFFDLARVGVGYRFGNVLVSLRLFIGMPF